MANDNNGEAYLRVRNLTKKFGEFTALKNVSLDVSEGEFVCFLGPSGCGKTTLLRAIAGLDIQTMGTVEQAGRDISALPPNERDFGIVFQSYALFPNLSVTRNIGYGLENRNMPKADIAARVSDLLDLVGLRDHATKYPSQLSGGQQQRVALARALATSPGLLLLDEPLSALDAKVRVHLRHEIKELQEKIGITTIMVTHDQEEALAMADRIVVMNHGVIEQVGSPEDIYADPASPFVADFIGTTNFVDGEVQAGGRVSVAGVAIDCGAALDGLNPGDMVTVCIRPEDVQVSTEGGGAGIPVTITDVEFLGSFHRCHVMPVNGAGQTFGKDIDFMIDLSAGRARDLGIREGMAVQAALPPEFVRIYRPVGGG
ncbi:MAG: putative 2-aminoethylphosphonate ABC transporter ATP-binding protein [Alphaproteobacteria bacterium]|nr:putative 2-aminoethylphosphonate ABC transporter ATP-binding protein [Magnetovibrio sp.]HBT40865.1 putative 2-aminoethylphosphonate ABC transporter ATP-binding protein [Rhodospirillaceae bacterium]HCS71684.1 putative 2-aminoethylphosphonate ABC transporter ATP-binding protein [Rhodospirillaceae bacterium]|tara:strand:- start:1095 stop:2210 length:1116 start_codon:yes stop_codon:yes gene_type:complete